MGSSSLTRDQTQASCFQSTEFQPQTTREVPVNIRYSPRSPCLGETLSENQGSLAEPGGLRVGGWAGVWGTGLWESPGAPETPVGCAGVRVTGPVCLEIKDGSCYLCWSEFMSANPPATVESGLVPSFPILSAPYFSLLSELVPALSRWVKPSGPRERGEIGEVFHKVHCPIEEAEELTILGSWERKQ